MGARFYRNFQSLNGVYKILIYYVEIKIMLVFIFIIFLECTKCKVFIHIKFKNKVNKKYSK